MRMWMINPKLMCNKHLIGEHGEIHKFLPSFRKGYKVDGRFNPIIQMQFQGYKKRHDELAKEMINRGLNHKSPLENIPNFSSTYPEYYDKVVDIEVSIRDLKERCEHCRERIEEFEVSGN